MLKILKLDENGEPIKNEDGTYVIDFNLDEAINNAIEEYKTTQSEEETKKAEEEKLQQDVETTHILYFCGIYIFRNKFY